MNTVDGRKVVIWYLWDCIAVVDRDTLGVKVDVVNKAAQKPRRFAKEMTLRRTNGMMGHQS